MELIHVLLLGIVIIILCFLWSTFQMEGFITSSGTLLFRRALQNSGIPLAESSKIIKIVEGSTNLDIPSFQQELVKAGMSNDIVMKAVNVATNMGSYLQNETTRIVPSMSDVSTSPTISATSSTVPPVSTTSSTVPAVSGVTSTVPAVSAASSTVPAVSGVTSTNIVNGVAPDSAYLNTITSGISNGGIDVMNATTAGAGLSAFGGAQQITTPPDAASSAAQIQTPATLNPSGLPPGMISAPAFSSDIGSATYTFMPTMTEFMTPASILNSTSQDTSLTLPPPLPQVMPITFPAAIPDVSQSMVPQVSGLSYDDTESCDNCDQSSGCYDC